LKAQPKKANRVVVVVVAAATAIAAIVTVKTVAKTPMANPLKVRMAKSRRKLPLQLQLSLRLPTTMNVHGTKRLLQHQQRPLLQLLLKLRSPCKLLRQLKRRPKLRLHRLL